MAYTHSITVPLPYQQAVERTRQALAEQGFGILTETDIAATFAAKLGPEAAAGLGEYVILGACNPALASRAWRRTPARRPAALQRRGQSRPRRPRTPGLRPGALNAPDTPPAPTVAPSAPGVAQTKAWHRGLPEHVQPVFAVLCSQLLNAVLQNSRTQRCEC